MKIVEVRSIPLMGRTPEGGWDTEIEPEENLHTLIEVVTDETLNGKPLTGIGSVYTSQALVEGALRLMRPWLIGECAIEPERVTEKLSQMAFWQGRGGAVTHAISGIDIALWDLLGKACGQPVARLLGGYYRERIKPYGSILFDEPDILREKLQAVLARGFRAIKLGWKPFGRVSRKMDELLVRTAREMVGPDVEIMVDAGGSEHFWPHGYKWAWETSKMLAEYDVTWFEEALPPDDIEGFIKLRENAPLAHQHRRGAHAPAELHPVDRARRGGHHPARLHQGWRAFGGAPHRLDGLRPQCATRLARLEHRRGAGGRPAPGRGIAGGALGGIPHALALHRRDRHHAIQAGCGGPAADPNRTGAGDRARLGRDQAVCALIFLPLDGR